MTSDRRAEAVHSLEGEGGSGYDSNEQGRMPVSMTAWGRERRRGVTNTDMQLYVYDLQSDRSSSSC